MKTLFASAVALGVFSLVGSAHAALVTYEFTANIDTVNDTNGILGLSASSTVTGTLSYDDSGATVLRTTFFGDGEIQTSSFDISGGISADGAAAFAGTRFSPSEFVVLDTDVLGTVNGAQTFYVEEWTSFTAPGGVLGSGGLGTLALADLSSATYGVSVVSGNFSYGSATGTITSLSLGRGANSTPASVPELSAGDAAGSMALLAGGALVFTARRRADES